MSDYRILMRELHDAHRLFHKELRRWMEGKLGLSAKEHAGVSEARDKFYEKLETLYSLKLYPLETKFRANPNNAADELIEFLSVDIPAYRCGYAKEFFLGKLKNIELSAEQIERLKNIVIEQIEAYHFRREFRRWCRLMIKLAGADFVEKLIVLSNGTSRYAVRKSNWMLATILHHRKDLKAVKPVKAAEI